MSRSDQQPDETQDPFDEELAALLARTAQDAQPNPSLARQVRERLSAGDMGHAPRSGAGRIPWLASLASVAVVALLLVAFAAVLAGRGVGNLRPGGGTSATSTPTTSAFAQACVTPSPGVPHTPPQDPNPPLQPNPVDHSVAVGASATEKGITVTVERAYADATQTVVTLRVSPDDGTYEPAQAVLVDAAGGRYQGGVSSSYRLPNNHFLTVMVFAPLPQAELGRPQGLTLVITSLMDTTGSSESSAPTPLAGQWKVPFTTTSVAGTAIPLSLPAQTHDGVTIQFEELDIAPAGGGLDGQSGGARVRFRISNLPTTAPLDTVAQYPTWFTYTIGASSGGGNGGGSGGGAPSGVGCHDSLTLTLANGVNLTPGSIIPAGQIVPISASDFALLGTQTVGSSGSIEAEALFFTPIPSGNVTLTINPVPVSEMRDGKSVLLRTAQGPWVFTVSVK